MERDGSYSGFKLTEYNFNSHAHVERDIAPNGYLRYENIFQLTRSRGAWLKNYPHAPFKIQISTHTLTWSVTRLCLSLSHWLSFQLTRSRGAWLGTNIITSFSRSFQLTRSRGAWRNTYKNNTEIENFNSHAHVERDRFVKLLHKKGVISTHTLTWSVTGEIQTVYSPQIFQLTRSRGAWRYHHTAETWPFGFQLTRSRGAWLSSAAFFVSAVNFNSHAHVERDLQHEAVRLLYSHFNSHAHVERDGDC